MTGDGWSAIYRDATELKYRPGCALLQQAPPSELIHIYFIDDFISFLDSRKNDDCVCDAPEILPLADDADLETKLAWQFATEQREKVCAIQCPITFKIQPKCGLERLPGQSDLEYELACEALARETQSLDSVSF